MKRVSWCLLCVFALAAAAPVFAGEETCAYGTQECLDRMVDQWTHRGWLGIMMDDADGVLTVTSVMTESPAESAGIQVGDILVAVNGVRYDAEDKAAMKAVRTIMVPGAILTYTVKREGKEMGITATLAKMPDELLARVIGAHMITHAQPVPAQD